MSRPIAPERLEGFAQQHAAHRLQVEADEVPEAAPVRRRPVAAAPQQQPARLSQARGARTQSSAASVIGLFGELYLIWRSADPVRTLAAWRIDEVARFDFSDGEFRLDVKAAGGRVRAHTCSYEQCNPPFGTTAVAASLFVERVAAGLSLRSLIEQIEAVVGQRADLALKLHEIVAATLGRSLGDALESTFDVPLADGSLLFFDLRDVPAIRESLPANVSDVHFRSDFSGTTPIAPEQLLATHPRLASFLPHPTGSNYSIS